MRVPLTRIDHLLSVADRHGWKAAARQGERYVKEWASAASILRRRPEVVWGDNVTVQGRLVIRGAGRVEIGNGVSFIRGSGRPTILALTDPDAVVRIGRGAFLNGATIVCRTSVDIGEGALVAGSIMDSDAHDLDPSTRLASQGLAAPVTIGPGAWIGEGSHLLRGANVGRDAVVGANAVIRGAVPDGGVAVGDPARIVSYVPGYEATRN